MPSCNIDQAFNEGRDDDGENWLVSTDYDQERTSLMVKQTKSYQQGRHGIESPNLKNEYRAGEGGEEAKPCVEDDCGNRWDQN